MMKNNRILYYAFSLLILLGACSNNRNRPANLQFVSMLPSTKAQLEVRAVEDSSVVHTNILSYAQPSGYSTFKPGAYHIRYSLEGEPLLEKKLVLGKNSYQTMLITGLKPNSSDINPQTFWYSIKDLLAGSEASSINGYMPQFIMLRDDYDVSPDNGMIRLVNAAPFSSGITLNCKNKTLFKDITYPHHATPKPVNNGDKALQFVMGKVLLNKKGISIQKGLLHTIIVGSSMDSAARLKITSYQTKNKQ